MSVATEFFERPVQDRIDLYSEDPKEPVRFYTSINYNKEEVHYWRDNLRHPCHPVEDYRNLWPSKPTNYREVVGTYSVEVRRLAFKLLELICLGLGLELGFFEEQLSKIQLMSVNYYPPCPDPSLTLGLPKHGDPNLLTLLLQGLPDGLQVFKDGEWISVDPIPNAFVVNLGHQLQVRAYISVFLSMSRLL
ncbi:Oxoglutarate/iron-dependent dioxygenase [Macleaya cordata]|uniref:Oxoglutarate/iron-dependent dioxygenase n=1 Tax=Macleaya cordata TaxID=56857 RepID=A0A200QFA0_MACCD|nr:Oxoglutarate/iron-dependent dioxygenase [Macleaya cordata]